MAGEMDVAGAGDHLQESLPGCFFFEEWPGQLSELGGDILQFGPGVRQRLDLWGLRPGIAHAGQ